MNISTKHQGESKTVLQNFIGGLNTSMTDELIDPTQLSRLVNLEINKAGQLRTVRGTQTVQDLKGLVSDDLICAEWDGINNVLVLFGKDQKAYVLDRGRFYEIGELDGMAEPICIGWEDGLLVASGGKLQYGKYVINPNNTVKDIDQYVYKLETISTSPYDCFAVSARSGRVFVFDDEDYIRYSGVGDESYWEQDSNDPSAAVFTQIGYKVGGKIIGMVSFQSYVLIFKDNGKTYRLENEYPDWVIKEVTSSCLCKGRKTFASVGSSVFVLGESTLQMISPTDDYGNQPVNYVGKQVENEIASLPSCTKMRFNAESNQLWFITNTQWVLIFDCNTQTFFQRYFNSDVVDLVGNFIIKRDKVCTLNSSDDAMLDDGEPLAYVAVFKTEMALNDILVKHVELSVSPLVSFYSGARVVLNVGRIKMGFPDRVATDEPVTKRVTGVTKKIEYTPSSELTEFDPIFLNGENLSKGKSILYKKRQVCRCRRVDVWLRGYGFPFVLNFIAYSRVEV